MIVIEGSDKFKIAKKYIDVEYILFRKITCKYEKLRFKDKIGLEKIKMFKYKNNHILNKLNLALKNEFCYYKKQIIRETVDTLRLSEIFSSDNIEDIKFIKDDKEKLELNIEKFVKFKHRKNRTYVYCYCPDMYRDIELDKNSINKIYNRKIKIEREVNIFEDEDVVINKKVFKFPKSWTKNMQKYWLKENKYPIHSSVIDDDRYKCCNVQYVKNRVIILYYIYNF
ncbi:hypothetical protein IR152_01335 [Clostridioides sp. ES-S-0108-01]|uniref:hypothetical protein n=1 Tax=Clostridioides sp. ES-S-0108-01 TaxID=2770773 RepID=UPI001D0C323C|nr:hypothetical protein [Clostridioides sp. ES-S-0108-01]UDN49901.1 hypothetical protein JJC16_11005 [Clostridioides sp. ES-S-0107-01]